MLLTQLSIKNESVKLIKKKLCMQLYNDMKKSIEQNIENTRGDFNKDNKLNELNGLPFEMDLTKCDEYEEFKNNHKYCNVFVKYNMFDAIYPYNRYYFIDWNKQNNELKIVLDD